MIIDAHTHLGDIGPDGPKHTVHDLVSSMDTAGIDMSLLITDELPQIDPEWRNCTIEEIIQESEVYRERLKIIANISITKDIQSQLSKIRTYIKDGIVVGIKMYPGYEDYFPDDERVSPVYSFASDKGIPVVFHTGLILSGTPGTLQQTHPLAVDQVAHNFPSLKIVMAHFGNPWIIDAAAVVWKNPNVHVDLSGFFPEHQPITQEEQEYFVRRVTEFTDLTGIKKCLFGTDWPLYSQKEYLETVQLLPMSSEEKDLVFWKNAVNVFKLSI